MRLASEALTRLSPASFGHDGTRGEGAPTVDDPLLRLHGMTNSTPGAR
ncbi:hypothetical protein [Streptosporangium fragile]